MKGRVGLADGLLEVVLYQRQAGQADGDLALQQAVGGVVGDALGLVVAALRLVVVMLKTVQVAKAAQGVAFVVEEGVVGPLGDGQHLAIVTERVGQPAGVEVEIAADAQVQA